MWGLPPQTAAPSPLAGRARQGLACTVRPTRPVTAALAVDLLPSADPVVAVNVLRRTALVVTFVEAVRGSLVAYVEAADADQLAAAAALLAACPAVRDLATEVS